MNISAAIKLSTEVSLNLFLCTSKDEIESVFKTANVSNVNDKIGLLQLCMGMKDFSPAPAKLTPEQQYEDILQIFTEGSWRFLI